MVCNVHTSDQAINISIILQTITLTKQLLESEIGSKGTDSQIVYKSETKGLALRTKCVKYFLYTTEKLGQI